MFICSYSTHLRNLAALSIYVIHSDFVLKDVLTDKYLIFNPHLSIQTKQPDGYDKFWMDYNQMTFEDFYKKYSAISIKLKAKTALAVLSDKMG